MSQNPEKLLLYGNIGIGVSRGGYQESDKGTVARLGISVSMYHIIFKFDRTVNNELSLFKPPEKVSSYSHLAGYSFQPIKKFPEFVVAAKYGIGDATVIKKGKIIVHRPFDDDYEFITETYSTKIFETDFELRFEYFGLYMGLFSESHKSFTNYGATIGALIGIL